MYNVIIINMTSGTPKPTPTPNPMPKVPETNKLYSLGVDFVIHKTFLVVHVGLVIINYTRKKQSALSFVGRRYH